MLNFTQADVIFQWRQFFCKMAKKIRHRCVIYHNGLVLLFLLRECYTRLSNSLVYVS